MWKDKNTTMNIVLKVILILLNAGMFVIALFWIKEDNSHEPYIVAGGQVGSVLILLFEQKISKIFVSKVSDSKVGITTNKDDQSNIKVRNIKNKSEVRIDRNND